MRSPLVLVLVVALLLAAGCGKRTAEPPPAPVPQPLASPAPAGSAEPHLSAGGGRVHLAWLARDGEHITLAYSTWSRDAWSAPRTIASGTTILANWADFPSLVPLYDGTFAAHWLERRGDAAPALAYDVRLARSFDGSGWSAPATPHRDGTATEHGFVSLVPEVVGGGTCIWLDGREYAGKEEGAPGAQMQLRAADWAPDGSFGEESVLDPRVCDCCQTSAVRTARGTLVAYRDRSEGEIRDIALVRRDAGGWTAPYSLAQDGWEITGCPVNGPALAANEDRVAAAWFTMAGGEARVNVAVSDDGGATFSPPIRIDEGGTIGRVDAVVLPTGDVVVVWLAVDASGQAEIRARRVRADRTLDPSFRVTTTSAERASGFPQVTASGDALYFAWTEAEESPRVQLATLSLPPEWAIQSMKP